MQLRRHLDPRFGQARALERLRVPVVHFEHLQRAVGIPAGEGVQSRTQDHVLADAVRHGVRQYVFGEPASGREERAQVGRDAAGFESLRLRLERRARLRADDAKGERVGQDRRVVE